MGSKEKSKEIRLFIVDDTPFIREIIKNIASSAGILVVGEADNGLDALPLIADQMPDVILMDIVMPKKNGIETTKAVLKENPHIKIIACSSAKHEKIISEAINAGCVDYITKPFTKETILEAINQSLEIEEGYKKKGEKIS